MLGTGNSTPRIVVLGAGFGGLYLTLELVKRLRRARITAEITLLDRNNYFLFSPLLHEVTAEMVEMHHVVHPIRQFLRGMPVRFFETAVEGVDLEAKTVRTSMGALPYDYLVLALGSVTNYFGSDVIARHAFPLKTLGEAFRLRNHILTQFEMASKTENPEDRRRLLTFVQAGAGFTGIETITELHSLVHETLLKDYAMIRPEEVRLLLVDGLPGLCVPADPALAQKTLALIEAKDIEVRFNTLVKEAGSGWVAFADGERVPTNTLIWAAGVTANPVIAGLPVEKGSMKRAKVVPTLQVPAYPEVFALGDCASVDGADGKPLPPTAQVANQQAPLLAGNLVRLLGGQSLQPFRFRRLGELASLGAYCAIADMGGLKFHGFLAWCIWRAVYLMKMPWWADRVHIAADWAIHLVFPRDTSRVEVGPCPACPLRGCPVELPAQQNATDSTPLNAE